MLESNSYVLAMYDIRGKQDYIYRRNKLKEIVGASLIIRDCFIDYLFPSAAIVGDGKGIYSYRVIEPTKENDRYRYNENNKLSEKFHMDDVIDKFNDNYIGYVIYDGGGNFFVIYKSIEIYKRVNKLFYTKLMKETSTLKVLTSYIEGINVDDYEGDDRKLREIHRKAENSECAIYPVNSLPIVQTDYSSSMPLTDIVQMPNDKKLISEKVCKESLAKYQKYGDLDENRKDEIKKFDDLVEKGIDSHIAVIYIDGNSMGAKVQDCLKGKKTYEDCINQLRHLSREIQEDYIDKPIKKITEVLTDKNAKKIFRFVVYAGDEITFICNAKYAYKVVEAYFDSLNVGKNQSSCAGIAIFHSHAPYSEAYRIAEECCEEGKNLMKERNITSACFMDFHYCQGAIGTSLKKIRQHEGTADMCLPWLIKGRVSDELGKSIIDKETINRMKNILSLIARVNNKSLLHVSKKSQEMYTQEIERIIAHFKGTTDEKKLLHDSKDFIVNNKNLLYRMMLVYDLWSGNSVYNKSLSGDNQ